MYGGCCAFRYIHRLTQIKGEIKALKCLIPGVTFSQHKWAIRRKNDCVNMRKIITHLSLWFLIREFHAQIICRNTSVSLNALA